MNKEEEAKKHKSDPVYQSHLKGWILRDIKPDDFQEEEEKFLKKMYYRALHPKDKVVISDGCETDYYLSDTFDAGSCCNNPDKYKNIISNSLKFYSCRNCGADLGNI